MGLFEARQSRPLEAQLDRGGFGGNRDKVGYVPKFGKALEEALYEGASDIRKQPSGFAPDIKGFWIGEGSTETARLQYPVNQAWEAIVREYETQGIDGERGGYYAFHRQNHEIGTTLGYSETKRVINPSEETIDGILATISHPGAYRVAYTLNLDQKQIGELREYGKRYNYSTRIFGVYHNHPAQDPYRFGALNFQDAMIVLTDPEASGSPLLISTMRNALGIESVVRTTEAKRIIRTQDEYNAFIDHWAQRTEQVYDAFSTALDASIQSNGIAGFKDALLVHNDAVVRSVAEQLFDENLYGLEQTSHRNLYNRLLIHYRNKFPQADAGKIFLIALSIASGAAVQRHIVNEMCQQEGLLRLQSDSTMGRLLVDPHSRSTKAA